MKTKFLNPFINVILILLAITFVGCSDKKSNKRTETNLRIGALAANGTPIYNGGLVVMGRKIGTSGDNRNPADSFNVTLTNESVPINLNLNQGEWEFFSMGWLGGAGLLNGESRCSYFRAKLDQPEQTVSATLTNTKCFSDFQTSEELQPLSTYESYTSGSQTAYFPILYLHICGSLVASGTGSACDTSANAPAKISSSYRVFLMDDNNKGNTNLATACIASSTNGTYLNIPLGHNGANGPDSLLKFRVRSYTNSSCDDSDSGNIDYQFERGLKDNKTTPNAKSYLALSGSGNSTYSANLYLEHNSATPKLSGGNNPPPWGNGQEGSVSFEYNSGSFTPSYSNPSMSNWLVKGSGTCGTTFYETYNVGSGYFGRVTEINSLGDENRITLSGPDVSNFHTGDKVLVHVSKNNSANCGEFLTGLVQERWIKSVVSAGGGSAYVAFFEKFASAYGANGPVNLIGTGTVAGVNTAILAGQCDIQIVKIPRLSEFSIANDSNCTLKISPPVFGSGGSGFGGILAFDTQMLTIAGSGSSHFDSSAKGYSTNLQPGSFVGSGNSITQTVNSRPNKDYYPNDRMFLNMGIGNGVAGGGIISIKANQQRLNPLSGGYPSVQYNVGGSAGGGEVDLKVKDAYRNASLGFTGVNINLSGSGVGNIVACSNYNPGSGSSVSGGTSASSNVTGISYTFGTSNMVYERNDSWFCSQ